MPAEQIIHQKRQLLEYFETGEKPIQDWRIGTEHETFIFQVPEIQRTPYSGHRGIEALLHNFQSQGWQSSEEHHQTLALSQNGASITLEPGGQFELSGAQFSSLHDNYNEMVLFRNQLFKNCRELGLALLSQGIDPKTMPEKMPWMPKDRYKIMRSYMPLVGELGLKMMTDTATIQVNLDYGSEKDLGKKLRIAMALQPLVTGLFANSPLHQGKLTGYKSYRANIWLHTDPARCGLLPFAFEDNFTYEKYLDYVLDVPMYFIIRNHEYENHAGHNFRDYLAGNLPYHEGELPTMKDFQDHLTVAFPEVRLKRYMEMRGADAGSLAHNMALCAFWVGLLYDPTTLEEVYELIKKWQYEDVLELLHQVVRGGLEAEIGRAPLLTIAKELLKLSNQGLKNRQKMTSSGKDESIYLSYLEDLLERGQCPADSLIRVFKNDCEQDVERYLLRYLEREPQALPLN